MISSTVLRAETLHPTCENRARKQPGASNPNPYASEPAAAGRRQKYLRVKAKNLRIKVGVQKSGFGMFRVSDSGFKVWEFKVWV